MPYFHVKCKIHCNVCEIVVRVNGDYASTAHDT